jgi:hypothetical protein
MTTTPAHLLLLLLLLLPGGQRDECHLNVIKKACRHSLTQKVAANVQPHAQVAVMG